MMGGASRHFRFGAGVAVGSTLCLGKWTQAGRYLAGDIDDFAIWRRALQPPEIAQLSRMTPTP